VRSSSSATGEAGRDDDDDIDDIIDDDDADDDIDDRDDDVDVGSIHENGSIIIRPPPAHDERSSYPFVGRRVCR
jgi:hypothetical protein